MLATSAHTKAQKGAKLSFPIFSYGEKKIVCQRGPWPNGPPKYATAHSYCQDAETISICPASLHQPHSVNTQKAVQIITALSIPQGHSTHPSHHHMLCPLPTMQISCLHHPCFSLLIFFDTSQLSKWKIAS